MGAQYHPNEFPELACWWLGRLLELPAFDHYLWGRCPLPSGIATLLGEATNREQAAVEVMDRRQGLQVFRTRMEIAEPLTPAPLARGLEELRAEYGLGYVDTELLKFLVVTRVSVPLYELMHSVSDWSNSLLDNALAHALRLPERSIQSAFQPTARLVASGLVARSNAIVEGFDRKFAVLDDVLRSLASLSRIATRGLCKAK